MTTATKYLTVGISAPDIWSLHDAIAALAEGLDVERIAAIRIDERARCAEMDLARSPVGVRLH